MSEGFLPKKGNYRGLDQMVQSARSAKQNIAEGCAASATSSETELKLMGVARASMKELLTDYEDYLRTRHLPQWALNDERTRRTQDFVEQGGIRERMTAARLGYRNDQKARIAELEKENAMLKARIAELEAQQKGGQR